jgi:hypothetical protein
MIVLQVIGLVIVTGWLGFVALLALGCAVFNNVGGNGRAGEVLVSLLVFALGLFAIYWVWANWSPFTVMVAP